MKNLFEIFCFLFLFSIPQLVFSQQKSIKANKQRTHFLYTSLNLQGGYFGSAGKMYLMPGNRGPLNQISVGYKMKNQRLLQKGVVHFMDLSAVRAKTSLVYDNSYSAEGGYNSRLKLTLQDIWVKFKTKWDRTSLKFGNFSLPFGHNPKVDPDYAFIPNIGGTDLGLSRDFGFLFKTPISPALDMELSLTSGGLLQQAILTQPLIVADETESTKLQFADFQYNGNALLTARIGNPAFKKREYGVFAIAGKMNTNQIYRIGFDWVYKHKEDLRVTNQLLFGTNIPDFGNNTYLV